MNVFEIRLKVFLMRNIDKAEVQEKITSFIDGTLAKDKKMLEFHEDHKRYKLYSYGGLQPIERSGIYRAETIYDITIRTVEMELAQFFLENLPHHENDTMKGLKADIYKMYQRRIERIYTVSPVIIKNNDGYWKNSLSFPEFEQRIKVNLIKKYQQFTGEDRKEDFDFYTYIQIDNKKPVSVNYKGIKLLGDKLTMHIADDDLSQKMARFALGAGLGEGNARGFGFVKAHFLKNNTTIQKPMDSYKRIF